MERGTVMWSFSTPTQIPQLDTECPMIQFNLDTKCPELATEPTALWLHLPRLQTPVQTSRPLMHLTDLLYINGQFPRTPSQVHYLVQQLIELRRALHLLLLIYYKGYYKEYNWLAR